MQVLNPFRYMQHRKGKRPDCGIGPILRMVHHDRSKRLSDLGDFHRHDPSPSVERIEAYHQHPIGSIKYIVAGKITG